jgi:hypothetical protein
MQCFRCGKVIRQVPQQGRTSTACAWDDALQSVLFRIGARADGASRRDAPKTRHRMSGSATGWPCCHPDSLGQRAAETGALLNQSAGPARFYDVGTVMKPLSAPPWMKRFSYNSELPVSVGHRASIESRAELLVKLVTS